MYKLYFHIEENATSQGLSYDFQSVMHFQHNAFASSPRKSTIVPRNRRFTSRTLGASGNGTIVDFHHIKILYCGGKLRNG